MAKIADTAKQILNEEGDSTETALSASRNSSTEHEDSVLYAEAARVPRCNNRNFHAVRTEFAFVDPLHKNCVKSASQNKQREIPESIPRLSSEIVNFIIKLICLWNEMSVIRLWSCPLRVNSNCLVAWKLCRTWTVLTSLSVQGKLSWTTGYRDCGIFIFWLTEWNNLEY